MRSLGLLPVAGPLLQAPNLTFPGQIFEYLCPSCLERGTPPQDKALQAHCSQLPGVLTLSQDDFQHHSSIPTLDLTHHCLSFSL